MRFPQVPVFVLMPFLREGQCLVTLLGMALINPFLSGLQPQEVFKNRHNFGESKAR